LVTIHIARAGTIIGLSYGPTNFRDGDLAAACNASIKELTKKQIQFKTQINVLLGSDGPKTKLVEGNLGGGPSASQNTDTQQAQPSWISQYWHYLLPIPFLLIATLVMGLPADDGGGGAGGDNRGAPKKK